MSFARALFLDLIHLISTRAIVGNPTKAKALALVGLPTTRATDCSQLKTLPFSPV